MFFFNKMISLLLSPIHLSFLLLLVGLFLLWFTKRQRAGKIMVSAGTIVLLLLSFSQVSDRLLKPLEDHYPPLMLDQMAGQHSRNELSNVRWIVVLGGGHVSDPNVPVTSQISPGSMIRLTEGVRLYRKFPGSRIVLAGGAVFDPVPEVETEAKVAEIMNVNRHDLVLEKTSKDTEDQAQFIKNIVGKDRFVLVTSASHMPRSVALFKKVGLDPIPAPTNYRVTKRQSSSPEDYIPSTRGLGKAENAIYEYLCLAWLKIRNKL
jgi:uncharacterized SAM-binding protein YcdF (DUF218 family)